MEKISNISYRALCIAIDMLSKMDLVCHDVVRIVVNGDFVVIFDYDKQKITIEKP